MLRVLIAIVAAWLLGVGPALAIDQTVPADFSEAMQLHQTLAAYRTNCIQILDEKGILGKIPPGVILLLTIRSDGKVSPPQVLDGHTNHDGKTLYSQENNSEDCIYTDADFRVAFKTKLPPCNALPAGSQMSIIVERPANKHTRTPVCAGQITIATAKTGFIECPFGPLTSSHRIKFPRGSYLVGDDIMPIMPLLTDATSQGVVFSRTYLSELSSDSAGCFTYKHIYLHAGEVMLAKQNQRELLSHAHDYFISLETGRIHARPHPMSTLVAKAGSVNEIFVVEGRALVHDYQNRVTLDVELVAGDHYQGVRL